MTRFGIKRQLETVEVSGGYLWRVSCANTVKVLAVSGTVYPTHGDALEAGVYWVLVHGVTAEIRCTPAAA